MNKIDLRNKIAYCVFTRNHGLNGTFKDITDDLNRIKELGTDIIWLMPIHPIGENNRKGKDGGPYSVKDYRTVNPSYGTIEDLKILINETHKKGMKLIIDVVFNHTSVDSTLAKQHPEWFYCNEKGVPKPRVEDWSDIVDLDFSNMELWDYLIDCLKYWADLGVDGYRCDVAPFVPLEFWHRARKEVDKNKERMIWIAETIDPNFRYNLQTMGIKASSDSEMYSIFDVTYDFDVYNYFKDYISGKISLENYLEIIKSQGYIYPSDYVKLRFLENHDQLARILEIFPQMDTLKMWTSFLFFQQGMTLIFAGQESLDPHIPDLFHIDKVDWSKKEKDFTELLIKLAGIKKEHFANDAFFHIKNSNIKGVIIAAYEKTEEDILGVFNVENKFGKVDIGIPDGKYTNIIDRNVVEVKDGSIVLGINPIIIKVKNKDIILRSW